MLKCVKYDCFNKRKGRTHKRRNASNNGIAIGTELYTMGYRALPWEALKISKQNSFITD